MRRCLHRFRVVLLSMLVATLSSAAVGQAARTEPAIPSGGIVLFPLSESFPANGGTGIIVVTAPPGTPWTAVSNDGWIIINSNPPGKGNGTVGYDVLAHGATDPRSGSITVNTETFAVLQGAAFLDVPEGSIFYTVIGKVSARGVTVGCGGGNYCPLEDVTREQMAAFILRSLGEFSPPAPSMQRYEDVPPDNSFYAFIDRMAVLGITSGCSVAPPLYCPTDPVTREQMAAFLLRALGEFAPPEPTNQRYADVPPDNPFYAFIDRLAVLGITAGCSVAPPLYCPGDSAPREQMAAFLVNAFDL